MKIEEFCNFKENKKLQKSAKMGIFGRIGKYFKK